MSSKPTSLVVIAHPQKTSLCHQHANHVIERLGETDHVVVVQDLYDSAFIPTLSASERQSYYADEYDDSQISDQAEKLMQARNLVLVFPTWWFGFPAILKGWFDRVWAPGIAFDHGENFGPIKPKLENLERVLVITTLGSPWWVDWLVLNRPVKKIISRAFLGACAPKAKLTFLSLYNAEKMTGARAGAFKTKIDQALTKWPL